MPEAGRPVMAKVHVIAENMNPGRGGGDEGVDGFQSTDTYLLSGQQDVETKYEGVSGREEVCVGNCASHQCITAQLHIHPSVPALL